MAAQTAIVVGSIALQAVPAIDTVLSRYKGDPKDASLSEIANAVVQLVPELQQLVPNLQNQNELLNSLQVLILNRMETQNNVLEHMAGLLRDYHRLDIIGQLSNISTLAAAVAQIKRLADNTEQMAGALNGIDENLRSINARGNYIPQHIYSYVKMMIERHSNDKVPHYFTVFNKSTEWHPGFADLQRADPLGPFYLGHKSDLDELCAFLAEEVRPRVGSAPVLHILLPTIGQLALCEAVKFPEAMRPCLIDGQLGNAGSPYVYICTPCPEDQACLRDVGVLKPREIWALRARLGLPVPPNFIRTSCAAYVPELISKHFHEVNVSGMPYPHVTILEASRVLKYFVDPTIKLPAIGVGSYVSDVSYVYLGPETPRTLGIRTRRPWVT